MKPRVKIILSLLFALLLIAFIPTYDMFIKDKIDSVEVVVVKANEEIKKSEKIDPEKLTIERRRKQDLVDGVVLKEEFNEIIHYDAANLLIGNSMLSRSMVDFDDLEPNVAEGEAIRPITNEMIYAKPGSLRRKDRIDIYVINSGMLGQKENTREEESDLDSENGNEPNVTVTNSEEVGGNMNLKAPILTDVRVIYAKDSSNQEVTNGEGMPVSENERLNSTGQISDLEVLLNEEDFQLLMESVIEEGSQLYITYN